MRSCTPRWSGPSIYVAVPRWLDEAAAGHQARGMGHPSTESLTHLRPPRTNGSVKASFPNIWLHAIPGPLRVQPQPLLIPINNINDVSRRSNTLVLSTHCSSRRVVASRRARAQRNGRALGIAAVLGQAAALSGPCRCYFQPAGHRWSACSDLLSRNCVFWRACTQRQFPQACLSVLGKRLSSLRPVRRVLTRLVRCNFLGLSWMLLLLLHGSGTRVPWTEAPRPTLRNVHS